MISSYAWRGGREACLRFGDGDGDADAPALLVLPPLFEEANRTRHFLVEVMRGLAARGIASVLPDLPGTNDSAVATADARLADWREAVAALPAPLATVTVRSGALLDDAAAADRHWRLAPETGARLLRDMIRSTALTSSLKAAELDAAARTGPTALAGNLLHPELFEALQAAEPTPTGTVRTVRLDGDAASADTYLVGAALWRRAEPDHDPVLAAAVVEDIAAWVTS